MAQHNGSEEKLQDVAQDVSKELRELGRELRHRANDVRKETAKQLHNAASTIRKEAREAGAGAETVQSADELAKGLEKAAHYMNSKSVEQMGDDTVKVVQRYPMRAVLITFVVGALIGLWLRGNDYNDNRR